MKINNKVILITGASTGLGKAMYDNLKNEGAIVYGTSRKPSLDLLYLDLNDLESIHRCINLVIKNEKKIDVLINNAGYGIAGAFEDINMDQIKKQFDVNFFGTLFVIKETLSHMKKEQKGKILVMSSVAGFLSIPYQSIYSSTKCAIESIIDSLYNETSKFGIEYMIINPGDTKTSFTQNRVSLTLKDSDYYENFKKSIKKMENAETKGMDPSIIANGIVKRLKRKKLPYRYVPKHYFFVYIFTRLLPKKLIFKLLKLFYL